MRLTTSLVVIVLAMCDLIACGGGEPTGGSGQSNAVAAGIWNGTESVTGLSITGLIDEAGEFHYIRADGVQYVGTASTDGNTISATFDGYTQDASYFPDGSAHGTGMAVKA